MSNLHSSYLEFSVSQTIRQELKKKSDALQTIIAVQPKLLGIKGIKGFLLQDIKVLQAINYAVIS